MNRIRFIARISLLALLGLSFKTTVATAQSPDFSGTWTYNESKSVIPEGRFRGAALKLVLTQDANNLAVERTSKGRDGAERKSNEKYTLDGKECENQGFQNNVRKSTVNWSSDQKKLNISSVMTFNREGETMQMKSTETWSLSEDLLTLTIEVISSTPNGDMKQTLIYDRAG
ncbi:MAG: hypothetical protein U0W24_18185 [Bacteroidales bacterium]